MFYFYFIQLLNKYIFKTGLFSFHCTLLYNDNKDYSILFYSIECSAVVL